MAVYLRIMEPGRPERTLTYTGVADVTIGRASGCDIRIDYDPVVSRFHAGLHLDPPSVLIKDLGSRNGISVNGMRFDGMVNQRIIKPRSLRDGDTIVLGRTVVRVSIVGAAGAPSFAGAFASVPSLPVDAVSSADFTFGDHTDTAMLVPVPPE